MSEVLFNRRALSSAFLDEEDDWRPPSALSEIFEEEPVSLETFISDKKFLGADWMLSPLQQELVRVGERIYLPYLYPLMAEEFGGYWADEIPMRNSIVAQWGKGGGKDSTVRVISARVAYLLLCLKSPQKHFGMPEDDSIHLLNIAVNAAQAQRAFFAPLSRMVTRSPWFKDRAHATRDTVEYAKNIIAISGHSDAESQEGLNILLGVADEIDAFKAKGEMTGQGNRAREASTSAESILNMIQSSATSRFPDNYKRIAISYPRYQDSTIQVLTAEAKADVEEHGDDSMFFASGPYSTWEVNPTKKQSDFAKEYRKDPDEAAAKYECKPTRAMDSYFRNPKIFDSAIDRERQPVDIEYRVVNIRSAKTGSVQRGWEPTFTFDHDFRPAPGAYYALHGDLAITGDRAGIAMSHVETWMEREAAVLDDEGATIDTVSTMAPFVRNDFTISFGADVGAIDPLTGEVLPREIQIRWVRSLAFELIKRGFPIGSFTFDGFQSTDSIQILTLHGIESERVSTDRDPDIWKTLKDVASDARLGMPPSDLLKKELLALSRVDKGKVDHPPNGSKDEADAFACSIVGAINLGGQEDDETTEGLYANDVDMDDFGGFSGGAGFGSESMGMPIGLKEVAYGGFI